jgi:hypothetical protein
MPGVAAVAPADAVEPGAPALPPLTRLPPPPPPATAMTPDAVKMAEPAPPPPPPPPEPEGAPEKPPFPLCAMIGITPSDQKDTENEAALPPMPGEKPPPPPPPVIVAVTTQPPAGASHAVPVGESIATDKPLPIARGWLIDSVTTVSLVPKPGSVASTAVMRTRKDGRTENGGKLTAPLTLSTPVDSFRKNKAASPAYKEFVVSLASTYERAAGDEIGAHHVQDDTSVKTKFGVVVFNAIEPVYAKPLPP